MITSITNIWASARTTKSKRIPRQRNDFIQEQNLHAGQGTWFSFTRWVLRVNPHRESRSGLYTTMDIHFSTWENTNARLIPSDFYFQVFDENRCYWQEEDNVSSNTSAAQTQIEKTSARCHFPCFLSQLHLPAYLLEGGPTFLVQIFMGLVPLSQVETPTPKAWSFPAI